MLLQTVKMPDVPQDALSSHPELSRTPAAALPILPGMVPRPATARLLPRTVPEHATPPVLPRTVPEHATPPVLPRTARRTAITRLLPGAAHRFYPAPAPPRQDALLPPESLRRTALPRRPVLPGLVRTTGAALLPADDGLRRNVSLLPYTIY